MAARSPIRALVVDDFDQWREFACTTLQEIPDVIVAGEACDGREAIELAARLRPDLVLLDIGLPSLNGIEVAREIRKICPESNIAFLTENLSNDVIEECLRAGASGYVIKSSAADNLIQAIRAALKHKTAN